LWHSPKFLQYNIVEFTPPLSLLPPLLKQFQQVSFFRLHICVQNIPTILTLQLPFLISSPLPLVPTSQTKPILPSCSLVFCKKKKKVPLYHTICLSVTATHLYQIWTIISLFHNMSIFMENKTKIIQERAYLNDVSLCLTV
jgi:hypothetical protein